MNIFFLAWLYFNPERVVFTVPIIDRPVVWYGLWFVSGFIVGYFMLIPMFQKILKTSKQLSARDISSWPALISALKNNNNPITLKLHRNIQRSIMTTQKTPELPLQTTILNAINATQLDRAQLEEMFPKAIFSIRQLSSLLVDKLTWFIVGGTLIGARLGHVFFYDWPRYEQNPLSIVKIWEGGLASHGGGIGVIIGLFLYYRLVLKKFPEIKFLNLLDVICIPTALVGCFIRIGNFVNQEILGTPTSVPWAVIFGDPMDGSHLVPRHPVQLYEAGAYLLLFFFLMYLWKKTKAFIHPGLICGLFFIILFTSRFFLEFYKAPQSIIMDENFLQTGQYLSLPYIAFGVFLILFGKRFSSSAQLLPE